MDEQKRIGKYELVGEIATGGMGIVYQAYDPFMDRFVALKIPHLQTENVVSKDVERLFYNEMHAAALLHHPNIIEVYDAGEADGRHYIAMEYIPGGVTLKRFCHPDNLLPMEIIGQMMIKAAEAFDFAHRKGIIHRDIKASNILLKDDREVKATDFGLAILSDPDQVDTQTVSLIGSPRYMAPERIKEESLTHQSDIYSLGVVMYELMTGQPPFSGETLPALTQQILTEKPEPVTRYRHSIPDGVDVLVDRSLAKNPVDRYQSMLEFASDISHLMNITHVPLGGSTAEMRTEQLRRMPFFAEFSDTDLWELLRWSNWVEVDPDRTVIREGDVDNVVYIIVEGKFQVSKGDMDIAVLKPGELFGEIAFLTERTRTASVTAREKGTLLSITISQIEQASKTCQIQFQRKFIATLINRLVRTTEQLTQRQH